MSGNQTSTMISYIVPAYNSERTLRSAVNSILNGNLRFGDEIIVVDDASTDSTPFIVSEIQVKHPIEYIRHKINKGSAAASRNTGIENAKNEYIYCLDSDNLLIPETVHALCAHMIKNGADAATLPEIKFFVGLSQNITHNYYFDKPEVSLSDALSSSLWFGSTGNYLFTKKSWLRAGRYNESVGAAYDSWAFGFAQLATGTKMVVGEWGYYLHEYGHESAFKREKTNHSLMALSAIAKWIPMLTDESINHILSSEYRYSWVDLLDEKPLKLQEIYA